MNMIVTGLNPGENVHLVGEVVSVVHGEEDGHHSDPSACLLAS